MGYRIQYGSDLERKPEGAGSFLRIVTLTFVFFLLFCVVAFAYWPGGREALGCLFFPGGGETALEAAEVFVSELYNGEPISDALEHFCRDIINHGNLP